MLTRFSPGNTPLAAHTLRRRFSAHAKGACRGALPDRLLACCIHFFHMAGCNSARMGNSSRRPASISRLRMMVAKGP